MLAAVEPVALAFASQEDGVDGLGQVGGGQQHVFPGHALGSSLKIQTPFRARSNRYRSSRGLSR